MEFTWAQLSDPARAIQAFFVFGTSTLLALNTLAAFRNYVVPYGARGTASTQAKQATASDTDKSLLDKCMGSFGKLQVPHKWFTQFYEVSVLSSLFWAYQIVTKGEVYQFLADSSGRKDLSTSMTIQQVAFTWFIVLLQGSRRLYEHLYVIKPSESKMGILQYLLGFAFYIPLGIAVWAEGIPAINVTDLNQRSIQSLIEPPSLKDSVLVPLYLAAAGIQHICHVHLASLKKYTLPTHPFFQRIISPHYTAELAIYAILSMIAAPQGSTLNQTILSFLFFSTCALSISANTTKEWYAQKFGAESVAKRWRIIPFIY